MTLSHQVAIVLTEESELAIGFLFGLIFLILGNYKRTQYNKLMSSGISTGGTIVEIEESRSNSTSTNGYRSNSSIYTPVISYKTLQGEVITKKYDVGRNQSPYKIGDLVTVIYDPADPETFMMKGDKLTRLIGPIFMMVGTVIALLVLVQYFWHPITFTQHGY